MSYSVESIISQLDQLIDSANSINPSNDVDERYNDIMTQYKNYQSGPIKSAVPKSPIKSPIFVQQREITQESLLLDPLPMIVNDDIKIKPTLTPETFLSTIQANVISKKHVSPAQKGANCSVYASAIHLIDFLFIRYEKKIKQYLISKHYAKVFAFMLVHCCHSFVIPTNDKKAVKFITSLYGTANIEILINAMYRFCGIQIKLVKLINKDYLSKYHDKLIKWNKQFGPLLLDTRYPQNIGPYLEFCYSMAIQKKEDWASSWKNDVEYKRDRYTNCILSNEQTEMVDKALRIKLNDEGLRSTKYKHTVTLLSCDEDKLTFHNSHRTNTYTIFNTKPDFKYWKGNVYGVEVVDIDFHIIQQLAMEFESECIIFENDDILSEESRSDSNKADKCGGIYIVDGIAYDSDDVVIG